MRKMQSDIPSVLKPLLSLTLPLFFFHNVQESLIQALYFRSGISKKPELLLTRIQNGDFTTQLTAKEPFALEFLGLDNPPVGILLCTHKGPQMIEYALSGMDNPLFVSTYMLQLPSKNQLRDFLIRQMEEFSK